MVPAFCRLFSICQVLDQEHTQRIGRQRPSSMEKQRDGGKDLHADACDSNPLINKNGSGL